MSSESKPSRRWPLFLAVGMGIASFVLYLITMPQWLTLKSVGMVSRVGGWLWWLPQVDQPLTHLVTLPFGSLSPGNLPKILNIFTSVCGAMVVGLLAHSICLLPADRTRYQRIRERNESGLLSLRFAWLPPIAGAAALALNLTFWEHAFAFTGEMINLLSFAYLVHALLIHRLDKKDWKVFIAAFVLGASTANDWAFIAWTPLFCLIVLVMKKRQFFTAKFLLPSAGLFLLGTCLYFVMPLKGLGESTGTTGFWDAVLFQLKYQKGFLFGLPKYVILIVGLTSLLPALVVGIRWPSNIGDVSILGAFLTHALFFIVNLMFLVVIGWVMFDPFFSPREIGLGLSWLSFTYLGALAFGYYLGFFQLLLSLPPSDKLFGRAKKIWPILTKLGTPLTGLVALGLPIALFFHNSPSIKIATSDHLERAVAGLASTLPDEKGIVVSDQGELLALTTAWLKRERRGEDLIMVDERTLSKKSYHKQLSELHGERWPSTFDDERFVEPLDSRLTQTLIGQLGTKEPLFFLAPQVGKQFLEYGASLPSGFAFKSAPYPLSKDRAPTLTAEDLAVELGFWESQKELIDSVAGSDFYQDQWIAALISRSANSLGVQLAKIDRTDEALTYFQIALDLWGSNLPALINLTYHQEINTGDELAKTQQLVSQFLASNLQWAQIHKTQGPVDHPDLCISLASQLSEFSYYKQASVQQARAGELVPESPIPHIALAQTYQNARVTQNALKIIEETRNKYADKLSITNTWDLIRIEALSYLYQTNAVKAESVLKEAVAKYPSASIFPRTLANIYLTTGQYSKASTQLDQQLLINPEDTHALLNKAALLLEEKKVDEAEEMLNRLLTLDFRSEPGLLNRSILHMSRKDYGAARKDLTRLKAINPNVELLYFYLGEINASQGFTEAAIENFSEYLQRTPNGGKASIAKGYLDRLESIPAK